MQSQIVLDAHQRQLAQYWDHWLSETEVQALWPILQALPWQQPQVTVFGQRHAIPRQQCYLGLAHCEYRYSQLLLAPEPLPAELEAVRCRLNRFLAARSLLNRDFNAILANHYRSGSDKMGWHRDNEPELGSEPYVAILSFGATRILRLRWQAKGASQGVALTSGSLLWLPAHVYHSIGSCRNSLPRISLTFRAIEPRYHQAHQQMTKNKV